MAFRNGCRATLWRTVVAYESVKTGDSQKIDYGGRSDSLESCAWGRENVLVGFFQHHLTGFHLNIPSELFFHIRYNIKNQFGKSTLKEA